MVWFNHLVLKRETHELCYLYFELMCFMLCLYVHIACRGELNALVLCYGTISLYACLVPVWEWVLVLGWAS